MPAKDMEKRREWCSKYYQTWRRKNPEQYMYNSAKRRAKEKNLDFNIEVSDIIIPEYCPILGIKLEMGDMRSKGNSPSLDRRDNSKGYVKGNICVISNKINHCKADLSADNIKALYRYVSGLD